MSALLLLLLAAPSSAAKIRYTPACDMKHHAKRAKELVELEAADQKDREGEIKAVDWNRIRPRDLKRRERAAAIFAEGCVKTAADYFNIAMIYQHGDAPDHTFQAYVWASRAEELEPGYPNAKWLSQAALDRYLMDNEYKQIYATQGNQDPAGCFCLWPVEKTATDDFRRKAGAKTIDDQLKWIADLNKNEPKCKAAVCPQAAKPAVKGVLPGVVW